LEQETAVEQLVSKKLHINNRLPNTIKSAIKDFYPNSYRLDEIELSQNQKSIKENIDGLDYNLGFMDELFSQFYRFDGSNIYAKSEYFEEYMALANKVHPYQIAGYKLSKLIHHKEIFYQDLVSYIHHSRPLLYPKDRVHKYAENHLHFKGSSYSPFYLIHLFNHPTKQEFFSHEFILNQPRINEFSYINTHQYSLGQIIEIAKIAINHLYRTVLEKTNEINQESIRALEKAVMINQSSGTNSGYTISKLTQMQKIFQSLNSTIEEKLILQIVKFYEAGDFEKAFLSENILFAYIYQTNQDSITQSFFKIYLNAINILRSYMVMSQNLDLSHFSEFSRSELKAHKQNAQNSASTLSQNTNYLNGKMGIGKSSQDIDSMVSTYVNAFEPYNTKVNFTLSTAKIKKESFHSIRYLKKRKALEKEAMVLDDFLRNVRYKKKSLYQHKLKTNPIKAIQNRIKWQKEEFDLSSYVVGIDAVGKETYVPMDTFAPFFRFLRKETKALKNNIFFREFKHHPRVLLSIHAGEDFNHIISGMRRVDEAVEYFGMEQNDRIGHALAIGIQPYEWVDSVQSIMLTKEEYFDNLVWLCRVLNKIIQKLPKAQYFLNDYRQKAHKLFVELYRDNLPFDIDKLFEAWEFRKNCPIRYFDKKQNKTLFDEYSLEVMADKKNQLFEIYHQDRALYQKGQEVIEIPKREISKDELEVWEALQDYLIDKYAQKGIIIESNPSSNIFISSLSEYHKHPIYRFHPPKAKYLKNGKRFNRYGLRHGKIGVTVKYPNKIKHYKS